MNGQLLRIPLSSAEATTGDFKPRKNDKRPKSSRFSLSLSEPGLTASSYKEYSLGFLLNDVKRDNGENVEDRCNSFGDKDEGEMAQLARQFEERYGLIGNPSSKQKKPSKYRDLVDLGDGYDASDSFIDNTDAFDEFVPYTITTKKKGFYINVGRLEFRNISSPDEASTSSADEHPKSLPTQKTRPLKLSTLLSSSPESSSAPSENEMDEKNQNPGKKSEEMAADLSLTGVVESIGEETCDNSVPKVKKRRSRREKADEWWKLNIKKLMKARSQVLKKGTFSNKSRHALNLKSKPMALDEQNVKVNQGSSSMHGSSPTVKTSAIVISDDSCCKVKLKDIDTVSKSGAALEEKSSPLRQSVSSSPPGNSSFKIESKSSMSVKVESAHTTSMLSNVVINGKSVASESTETDADVPMESSINEMLLRDCCPELEFRMMSTSSRMSIDADIDSFLPEVAQTQIKSGKELAREIENGPPKVKTPLIKLKELVDSEMIGLQKKYHAELEKAKKKRQELKGSTERVMTTDSNSEDGEEGKVETILEKKRIVRPRKKFLWNCQCRLRLRAAVNSKLKQLNLTKDDARKSEQLLSWYSDQVVTLWPKGWMTVKILLRES